MPEEIIVTVEPGHLHLKCIGNGRYTALQVVKNRTGQHRWKTDAAPEQLICQLALMSVEGNIASVLNRLGIRRGIPGRNNGFLFSEMDHPGVAAYRESERAERGEVILHEAAICLHGSSEPSHQERSAAGQASLSRCRRLSGRWTSACRRFDRRSKVGLQSHPIHGRNPGISMS